MSSAEIVKRLGKFKMIYVCTPTDILVEKKKSFQWNVKPYFKGKHLLTQIHSTVFNPNILTDWANSYLIKMLQNSLPDQDLHYWLLIH